jgi:hypothetical protein
MPELRDLLEGAVEHPAPLDMGDLANRVTRHRRRQRVATYGTAVLLVCLLGALALAARRSGSGDDVDITIPPGTDEPVTHPSTTASTAPDTTTSTSQAGTGGALPACTPDDLDVTPTGEGATAQMAVYADVAATGRACALDTTVTITLRDATTDEPLDVTGNPATATLSGSVGPGQPGIGQSSLVWSGCVPGVAAEATIEVTVEAAVDGLGTYRGTSLTPRCEVPGSGSSIGPVGSSG